MDMIIEVNKNTEDKAVKSNEVERSLKTESGRFYVVNIPKNDLLDMNEFLMDNGIGAEKIKEIENTTSYKFQCISQSEVNVSIIFER